MPSRASGRAALALAVIAAMIAGACGRAPAPTRGAVQPEYDRATGKLTLIRYDSDGDGRIDTWSYMDGARVVRIEIDKNEDGRIDRWEYYGADGTLAKIGLSRADDGKEDTWAYQGSDGSIARMETSTARGGRMNRVEYYEKGVLVRAEEDTNGDSKPDKWETWDGVRLTSVAFDSSHLGTPDRRLDYSPDGSVHVVALAR